MPVGVVIFKGGGERKLTAETLEQLIYNSRLNKGIKVVTGIVDVEFMLWVHHSECLDDAPL